ncbi:MAG: hypothetical protein J6P40_07435 [Oscillospiraceae bacterium]|nr:hypothetical protein [Oscillospiraceae bacterium]
MVWNILIIISLVLSGWSAWATWQNTQTIKRIMEMIDHLKENQLQFKRELDSKK